ncbi:MAG TPA: hypothetical protein PLO24_04560 [Bacteroidales bacterium]|jgi:septal ring factor EnvC (AmiA/AmiB activator)|nr:hypothetical protein [Bacteroidales bacterium]HOS72411.1 hypothetical protein [Bacteroidales bacterium]HQH24472.1 hypothetical protein [Bacteroidales bacterium]HQJ82546.1 hypothetical protein [Bacteroidales bacterium]
MKLKTLLFSGALFTFAAINAQKPIVIQEDSLNLGANRYPAISVLIPEVKYEKTRKNWIRKQETGTKSKVVDDAGKMSIFGAKSKNVSPDPFNILSMLADQDSVLRLTAAFEIRKDVYIERSTGEAELAKAKTFLFDFAKDQYTDLVNDQLKQEQSKLKDLEKELRSLEKRQSGMEKDIRTGNRQLVTEREKLTLLNNELTTSTTALAEHNAEYMVMEPGDEKDAKARYIKDLEKQKRSTVRSIKKSEKRIRNAESKISRANRAIPKNDSTQERIRRLINDQENVVQLFSDKLSKVKAFK